MMEPGEPQQNGDVFGTAFGARARDFVRVRCPECFKGFQVEVAQISETRPRFECSQCQARFSVLMAQALESETSVIGFLESPGSTASMPGMDALVQTPVVESPAVPPSPVAPTQAPLSTPAISDEVYSCPKCSAAYRAGETECKKCGVVFLSFLEHTKKRERLEREEVFQVSKEVRHLWDDVLANYDNLESHQNFVSAAWADNSLDYAGHKYTSILELAPHDVLAQKFQTEIKNLAGVKFEIETESFVTEVQKPEPWIKTMLKSENVQGYFRRFTWTNLILVTCGFLIMTGILVPALRNLVGFGSAVVFFILALKYYFRVF